jgi:membrane protease YdiL (CAAX protease family)
MTQALYAPWPESARRTWGWGAIGLMAAGYLVSSIPVLIGTIIYTLVLTVSSGETDPLAAQQALNENTLTVLLPLMLLQFISWAAMTLMWVKLFERRPLSTIGLERRGFFGRYMLGLPLGVCLVVLVSAVAALLSLGASAADADTLGAMEVSRAITQAALIGYAGLFLGFLIQGGVEELIFRGWLMSALTARWGKRWGVFVASFAFALLHAHVFISGLMFGVLALSGIGLTGLVFSLTALWRRSIVEAAAAHGAFNAVAVIAPSFALLASDPDQTIKTAVAQVFSSATGMAGADAVSLGPETYAQLIAMGGLSVLMLIGLIVRGRKD